MAPVEVSWGGRVVGTSGAERTDIPLSKTDLRVVWNGDSSGVAAIANGQGEVVASFPLSRKGDKGTYPVEVEVAPIEKGESPTKVTREITVKRV